MDLDEIRAFLAVAETGSLLTAAKSLQMSRQTLRRRIDQLEARAGVALLDRTRTGAALTEAGTLLATRGRLFVQEASALVASVRDTGSEPSGALRVVLPVGLPPHAVTPLFGFVRARFPKLTYSLRFSEDPLRDLLVDVDVAAYFGKRRPEGPWVSRQLARIPIYLIASPDYLKRRGVPSAVGDLASHDLLAWEGPGQSGSVWPLLDGTSVQVTPIVVARDIHLVRQLAIAGQGIALVPDGGLPDPGAEGNALVRVLPDVVGGETAISVVVPSALTAIPRVRAVLSMLEPFLADLGL
jgi:DNA-binding transcriptional LysR family regulator